MKKKFTNKELVERLNAIGIHNLHNLCARFGKRGKDDVFVVYKKRNERACSPNKAHVASPHRNTDLKAHWADNGCKTFLGKSSESVPVAVAWATEKYDIAEWVTSPFDRSDRVPKTVLDRAIAYLTVPPEPKEAP